MNCSLDPGASTSAAFVNAPASGAHVITSRIPCLFECLAHRRRSYIFPTILVPFVEKSLIPDVVVQQAVCSGARVDANRVEPPQMRMWEVLCGVFWKHHLSFLVLVFSEMKLGYVCEAASRTGESLYEENDWQPHGRLCERNSDSVQGTRRTQLGPTTRPASPSHV